MTKSKLKLTFDFQKGENIMHNKNHFLYLKSFVLFPVFRTGNDVTNLFALQKDYLKMMSFKANCMNSHMMISLLPSKKTWLWILQQFICWSLQAMIWFISQLSSHSSISAIRCILCSVYDKVRFSCGSEWKKGVDRRQSKIKGHPKKVVQKAF